MAWAWQRASAMPSTLPKASAWPTMWQKESASSSASAWPTSTAQRPLRAARRPKPTTSCCRCGHRRAASPVQLAQRALPHSIPHFRSMQRTRATMGCCVRSEVRRSRPARRSCRAARGGARQSSVCLVATVRAPCVRERDTRSFRLSSPASYWSKSKCTRGASTRRCTRCQDLGSLSKYTRWEDAGGVRR